VAEFISHYPDSSFIQSFLLRLRHFLPSKNPHVRAGERPLSKWAAGMTKLSGTLTCADASKKKAAT